MTHSNSLADTGPRIPAGIPRVDLKAQREALAGDLRDAAERVMSSGRYILGPEVEAFEAEFAAYCEAAHCVTVGSGTDALRLALGAAGIGPGDEVVTVAHTVPATAFAVELCGATPVFVDVEPDTYTMDPHRAADAIGPRTRALLPVQIYGQCADMDPLRKLARAHDLLLIEDAAQAHGATYRGRRAGVLGDIGCFSFYPTKNLGGYGDGGAIVTDNPALAGKVRLLRDYGRTEENCHVLIAGNSRLDELQAALLRVKLPHLDGWNEARRRRATIYAELLDGVPLAPPRVRNLAEHVFYLYVVATPSRDELRAHLSANGIGTGVHFPLPVHLQPAYRDRHQVAALPTTEQRAKQILSLPMYPELTKAGIERVADLVREFLIRERCR